MAAPSPKKAHAEDRRDSRKASVRLAEAQDQALAVLDWRDALPEQWSEANRHAGEPAKWSRRRTAAFIALSCGGFWTGVALVAARLAH